MLVRVRHLKILLAFMGCLLATAQAAVPSVEAMKAALPSLQGKARLGALLDLTSAIEVKAPQDALAYADEGVALAVKEGDPEKEAAFLSTIAFCCSQTGDFSRSIEYGKRALELGTRLGNRDRMAKAHNALGITYTFIGAYSQALEESIESLRIREELKLESAVTQSLNLIGVVYHHSGQYERAIEYFNQILKRIQDKHDTKRLILTKLNIGFAQYKLGKLAEALKNHQEALDLSLASKETTYVPYAYLNMGMTLSDLKSFQDADRYLRMAQAEYGKREQSHGLVQVLNARARMHYLAGDFAKGIPFALEGAAMATKINARDELRTSYDLLSDLYTSMGNVKEAFRYYKLAVQAKESIFTIQESNRIAEATMKVVTLKKDNEIEALKQERLISALNLEKGRYLSLILVISLASFATIIIVLGIYNRKMRENRKSLQKSNLDLARINDELQDKINEIKTLSGLLPICAQCKKIRDDEGYWNQLEGYISDHSGVTFSHSICPNCAEDLYPEAMERIRSRKETPS